MLALRTIVCAAAKQTYDDILSKVCNSTVKEEQESTERPARELSKFKSCGWQWFALLCCVVLKDLHTKHVKAPIQMCHRLIRGEIYWY